MCRAAGTVKPSTRRPAPRPSSLNNFLNGARKPQNCRTPPISSNVKSKEPSRSGKEATRCPSGQCHLASVDEAMDMVRAGLSFLARADTAELPR